MKALELVGSRNKSLVITERSGSRNGRSTWSALCDCGRSLEVVGWRFMIGEYESCGCKKKERIVALGRRNRALDKSFGGRFPRIFTDEDAAFRKCANTYKYQTKYRTKKVEWQLSMDDAIELLKSDCFYCGGKPATANIALHPGRPDERRVSIRKNGIDRVDSDGPYSKENCVPCCYPCNRAKSDMTQDEFIDMCVRVAEAHGYRMDLLKLAAGG